MAHDYQLVAFRDTAPLSRIGLYDGSPYTLDVRGQNFADVVDVRVNGVRTSEFIILSQRRMLVEIPRSQRNAVIETVTVLNATLGITPSSMVSFEILSGDAFAEGRTKLVQAFLKLWMTTPGTDIFNPSIGGGLVRLTGRYADSGQLRAQVALSITETQTQLIRLQSGDPELGQSERLKSVTLLSSDFSPSSGVLALRIRITAVDGSSADTAIMV